MKIWLKLSACALLAVAYFVLLALYPFSLLTFLPGILVCAGFASLIHELGHRLAYALLGLKWKRTTFSIFVLDADSGLRMDKDRPFFSASCVCAYDPEIATWRYDLALLSGSILCGILGGAALGLAFAASGSGAAFLQCFGVVSFGNALLNLLPFSADRILMREIRKEREKQS